MDICTPELCNKNDLGGNSSGLMYILYIKLRANLRLIDANLSLCELLCQLDRQIPSGT